MHINLFRPVDSIKPPQHTIYQRAQQSSLVASRRTPASPQDIVTLSPEAMKTIRVDHKSHHQTARVRVHDNKINSIEKWVEKATSKTEANYGKIPFGMEWKLEYISTRINKALTSNIDEDGKKISLTDTQQKKLIQINNKINNLLYPRNPEENTAVIKKLPGDNTSLVPQEHRQLSTVEPVV